MLALDSALDDEDVRGGASVARGVNLGLELLVGAISTGGHDGLVVLNIEDVEQYVGDARGKETAGAELGTIEVAASSVNRCGVQCGRSGGREYAGGVDERRILTGRLKGAVTPGVTRVGDVVTVQHARCCDRACGGSQAGGDECGAATNEAERLRGADARTDDRFTTYILKKAQQRSRTSRALGTVNPDDLGLLRPCARVPRVSVAKSLGELADLSLAETHCGSQCTKPRYKLTSGNCHMPSYLLHKFRASRQIHYKVQTQNVKDHRLPRIRKRHLLLGYRDL